MSTECVQEQNRQVSRKGDLHIVYTRAGYT